jgi:predicted NUDIX family NTP pyrophosphohydrolase
MKKDSAGLLMYRVRDHTLEVLLAHPGGPFWRNKDAGAWTIPKGEIEDQDDPLQTAMREFEEETSMKPQGPFQPLGSVKQKAGKTVYAWAFQGDCDPTKIQSNPVELKWPPRSGKKMSFPEIDRAKFFNISTACEKVNSAQVSLLRRLEELLALRNKESPKY